MNAEDATNIWSVLLPVLIGGFLGILGTAIGPIVSNVLASLSATREKRICRFEELIESVYDHIHWLDVEHKKIINRNPAPSAPEPIWKAKSLAAIYFRELLPAIDRYNLHSTNFRSWMASSKIKLIYAEIDKNQSEALFAEVKESFSSAYGEYLDGQQELLSEIVRYASERDGRV